MKSLFFLLTLALAWGGLTNICKQTGEQTQTNNQTPANNQTPNDSNSSTPSPVTSPSIPRQTTAVSFPARVGVWRLSKTVGNDDIMERASDEGRTLVRASIRANGAIYVAPDGSQVVWADVQFDSPERARAITKEIVAGVRQTKRLRIIYDTPANGSMFADSQDSAVAFSSAENSVQMFLGKGSENLRSFIDAASKL